MMPSKGYGNKTSWVILLCSLFAVAGLAVLVLTKRFRAEFNDAQQCLFLSTQRLIMWCVPGAPRNVPYRDISSLDFSTNSTEKTFGTVKINWEVNAKFRDGTTEPIGTFDSGPFCEGVLVASWRNFIVSRAPECVVNAPGLAQQMAGIMNVIR